MIPQMTKKEPFSLFSRLISFRRFSNLYSYLINRFHIYSRFANILHTLILTLLIWCYLRCNFLLSFCMFHWIYYLVVANNFISFCLLRAVITNIHDHYKCTLLITRNDSCIDHNSENETIGLLNLWYHVSGLTKFQEKNCIKTSFLSWKIEKKKTGYSLY